MNTPTPHDPRSLAHRLTTVGQALHHRLFAQLRESDLHPKTVMILSAIDGRVDAPWLTARLARGGKRLTALAESGWITRTDEGWSLTDDGRAVLDRVDAERTALLADVPTEQLEQLSSALDSVAASLGVDDSDTPRRGFGPGTRPGFGPHAHPGIRPAFGPNLHHGFRPGTRPPFGPDEADRTEGTHGEEHGRPHRGPGAREHRGDRRHGENRAFERGFEAGFRSGRDTSASE